MALFFICIISGFENEAGWPKAWEKRLVRKVFQGSKENAFFQNKNYMYLSKLDRWENLPQLWNWQLIANFISTQRLSQITISNIRALTHYILKNQRWKVLMKQPWNQCFARRGKYCFTMKISPPASMEFDLQ